MKTECIHATVSGKVQGVFYRESTKQMAQSLSITGWVKNNTDGTVELIACGTPENIEKLVSWLHQGPPAARVTDVITHAIPAENHTQFIVVR